MSQETRAHQHKVFPVVRGSSYFTGCGGMGASINSCCNQATRFSRCWGFVRVAEMTQQTAVLLSRLVPGRFADRKNNCLLSLQTAMWTPSEGGRAGSLSSSSCQVYIFQNLAEKAGSQPTRPVFSAVGHKDEKGLRLGSYVSLLLWW